MRGVAVFALVFLFSFVNALPRKHKPMKEVEEDEDEYYTDEEEDPLPQTSFSCQGKKDGFYADIEANCRVFHYCQTIKNFDGDDEKLDRAFFCPPTTIFRQEYLTCTTPSKSFNCSDSEKFYDVIGNPSTTTPTMTEGNEDEEGNIPTTPSPSSTTIARPNSTTPASPSSSTSTIAATSSKPSSTTTVTTVPSLDIQEYPLKFYDPIMQDNFGMILAKIKPAWVSYQREGVIKNFRIPLVRNAGFTLKFTPFAGQTAWTKVDHNVNQLMKIYSKLTSLEEQI